MYFALLSREEFGIVYEAHNALEDAMACGKLVQMAAEKFGCANVEELLESARLKMKVL